MYKERISTIYKVFTVDFNRFANPVIMDLFQS